MIVEGDGGEDGGDGGISVGVGVGAGAGAGGGVVGNSGSFGVEEGIQALININR